LLETVKPNLTKNVEISVTPTAINREFVDFLTRNMKQNPGKSVLKLNVYDPEQNLKVSLHTSDKGFVMNDDLADFLMNNLDIDVSVAVA